MIIFLHGSSALKIVFILMGNFLIAKLTCSSANPEYLGPSLTWVFNGLVLYSNEIYGGYNFAHLHPSLSILVRSFSMIRTVTLCEANPTNIIFSC